MVMMDPALGAAGGMAVGLASVLRKKNEIIPHLLINVLIFRVPIKPLGDGFQVDGHGFEFRAPVLGDRPMDPPAVVHDENESPALFLENMPFEGIEVETSRKLDVVFF